MQTKQYHYVDRLLNIAWQLLYIELTFCQDCPSALLASLGKINHVDRTNGWHTMTLFKHYRIFLSFTSYRQGWLPAKCKKSQLHCEKSRTQSILRLTPCTRKVKIIQPYLAAAIWNGGQIQDRKYYSFIIWLYRCKYVGHFKRKCRFIVSELSTTLPTNMHLAPKLSSRKIY